MKLEDFKNKKITVMGIGLHGGGVGAIKFLTSLGAKILATDLRQEKDLKDSLEQLKGLPIKYVLGEHRQKDFIGANMIIKNPAIPENSEFLVLAREKKITIESDIGIFFELCPAPIIGITGTRGKSTTASLLAHILKQKFPQTILAGNIRQSVFEKLPEITKDSVVILELSSWQLADAKEHKKSPYISLITNIMEDHLNRYAEFQNYIDDKKLIFKFQKESDYLFLDYSDSILKEFAKEAKSKIYFYSQDGDALIKEEFPSLNQKPRLGAYLKNEKIYLGTDQEEICSMQDTKLIGRHNLRNILAATSIAALYDLQHHQIKTALQTFNGLEGRLQLIAEIKKIKYINDTTATSPDASIAAIKAISKNYFQEISGSENNEKRIILIAGGADKSLKFSKMADLLSENCKAAILLEGSATGKLKKAINNRILVKKTNNMIKAVNMAEKIAKPGDVVLLSPGCASFGLFKHEFERGREFNEAVYNLKNI